LTRLLLIASRPVSVVVCLNSASRLANHALALSSASQRNVKDAIIGLYVTREAGGKTHGEYSICSALFRRGWQFVAWMLPVREPEGDSTHRRYPHKSGTFPDAVHRGFVITLELCGLLSFRFVEDTPGSGKPCMGCIFVYLLLFVWVVTLKANVDK
jgi:hypothetical protein